MNLHLLLAGIIAHVIADWFLQNHWQATYKTSLKHPAAWIHSGLHLLCYLFVFAPLPAFVLFVSHILIDTRKPLQWWRILLRQSTDGPAFIPFAMWQDQMAHFLCMVAVVRWLCG